VPASTPEGRRLDAEQVARICFLIDSYSDRSSSSGSTLAARRAEGNDVSSAAAVTNAREDIQAAMRYAADTLAHEEVVFIGEPGERQD
jgi:hypothetical protein